MKKLKKFMAALPEQVTVTRMDGILIVTVSALVGVIVGMLCSPRKNITCGCGNGTTTIHNWGNGEEDFDEAEETPVWEEDEEIISFK